jgi:hypothetical protein
MSSLAEWRPTRRTVVTLTGLALGGAALSPLIRNEYSPQIDTDDWIETGEFEIRNPRPNFDYSPILLNSPFAWRHPEKEQVRELLNASHKLHAGNIRIMLNDEIEPEIGSINQKALQKTRRFLDEVYSQSPETKIMIDLFDCFYLLYSEHPTGIYKPEEYSSPYLLLGSDRDSLYSDEVKKRQRNFFEDSSLIAAFKNRTATLVNEFVDHPAVGGWTIANEPMTDSELLSYWYDQVAPPIKDIVTSHKKNHVIYSGLAKPWLVDDYRLKHAGVDANTLHLYSPPTTEEFKQFRAYLYRPFPTLPVTIQEIGSPLKYGIAPVPFPDQHMQTFYANTLSQLMSRVADTDRYIIPFFQVGPWKWDRYNDGFSVDADRYPKTADFLLTMDRLLEKAR